MLKKMWLNIDLLLLHLFIELFEVRHVKCNIKNTSTQGINIRKRISDKPTVFPTEYAHENDESLNFSLKHQGEFIFPGKLSNETSVARTNQSTHRNIYCYRQTLVPILELLKEHGLVLHEKDVENTEIFGWNVTGGNTSASKLYFKVTLNIKNLIPSKLDTRKEKKKLSNRKAEEVSTIFTSEAIYLESMESVSLLITSKNFYTKMKPRIEILLEFVSGRKSHRDNTKRQVLHSTKGIINRLFRLHKREIKSLKFQKFKPRSIYFGLIFASVASTLCGLSFVLKKRSLLQMDKEEVYYRNKGWWMAQSLMIVGDVLHFVAFFFAPAVLVCMLQMLMILVTAFASSNILGEKINKYWKLGFATSLGGCLVIIVHVPKEPHIYNIETFQYLVTAPVFVTYNILLLFLTIVLMRFLIPKWGQINSLAYTVQSAIFGSVVVVALKGVLLVFTDKLFHWLPLTCVLVVAICLLLQFEYLNKALHFYNTMVVTTQYYVSYSALVIISLTLLFEVWKKTSDESILIISLGFATTAMGVLIFAVFQEDDATFDFSKLFVGPDATYQK